MFAEAAVLHATFLNPKWHPAVTRRMQEECCWEEFTDRSGYRFELKTVNLTSPSGATATTESSGSSLALTVPLGGTLNYSLAVENTGWSSLFSQRRAYLILTQTVRKGDMVSVAVDGEVEEWPQVRSGWEDEQSAYTAAVADVRSVRVANDEDHLYIFVSFYNVTDGEGCVKKCNPVQCDILVFTFGIFLVQAWLPSPMATSVYSLTQITRRRLVMR